MKSWMEQIKQKRNVEEKNTKSGNSVHQWKILISGKYTEFLAHSGFCKVLFPIFEVF